MDTAASSASQSRARADLMRIYAAAIAAADPAAAVARAWADDRCGEESIAARIAAASGIRLLAVGKAASAMAAEAERRLGARLVEGLVIAPPVADPAQAGTIRSGPAAATPLRSRIIFGSHPLPDGSSEAAAHAAFELASRAQPGQLFLLALSGGASALMAAPAGDVKLADKIAVTTALMSAGASIRELNTVRKHLSLIKGGRLLAALSPEVPLLSLVLSDVPGNDLATIGSGPAAADPTTFHHAIGVLKRRRVWGRAPEAVRDHLERGAAGEFAETLKADAAELARAFTVIVADNNTALDAAGVAAAALGYRVERAPELAGEADEAGRALAARLAAIVDDRVCVIAGGETVVTIRGRGRGGRSQQCALAMALELGRVGAGRRILALFAGTDGIDGPTDAAGAIATPATVARAAEARLDPAAALARNDAYPFFASLGDLVITGPTGTNVADLFVGLVNY